MKYQVIATVLFLLSLPAAAQPAWQLVGQGQFSYLFWDLYQAQLFSTDGRFDNYQQTKPLKLELTYQRDIAVTDFVDATLDQWEQQHGKLSADKKRWGGLLSDIWRDVKTGDRLACVYLPNGHTEFLLNGASLGVIDDPAFGPVFLDIWLGANTTAPKLRAQLLGQKNS
jgi:hypothetical protein